MEKKEPSKPIEKKAFLCIGNEMFEGTIKLTRQPKNDENFPAPGAIFTCKNSINPEGIEEKDLVVVGELSPLNHLSLKQARQFLLDAGFMQVSDEEKDAIVEQCAPELALVEAEKD